MDIFFVARGRAIAEFIAAFAAVEMLHQPVSSVTAISAVEIEFSKDLDPVLHRYLDGDYQHKTLQAVLFC